MRLEYATNEQKVNYIRGRLYAAGETLVRDEKFRMFYHVLDADGNDLTGAKTIDAVLFWLDNERKKGD